MRIPYISLLAAGALTLGGCAYGMYGDPYGYGPYGTASVGIGYSNGYYGGYGSPYYGGYGGYYGSSYYGGYDPFGWYGDYYYPGVGTYVYDSYRRPHVWTSGQRTYWTSRVNNYRTRHNTSVTSENWSGFNHRTNRTNRTNDSTTYTRRHHNGG